MRRNYFSEWKERPLHKGELFISDGILDESRWERTNLKVLFLLKEAYGEKGEFDLDLCETIREDWKGWKYFTWHRIAEWTYGLRSLAEGRFNTFPEDDKLLNEALLSSAVVNLKKSKGESRSDDENLRLYVDADWDLLEKQISDINPDVVVCGNTWRLINDRFNESVVVSDWIHSVADRVFVDVYHPAYYQIPPMYSYHTLCSLVHQSGVLSKFQRR